MKNILYTIALYALFVSGCSNESILTQNSQLLADEPKPNIYLGKLSKSLKDAELKLNIKKGLKVGKNIQFFIDSDYNKSTGYINRLVDGADYLIENETIFKSMSNGSSWDWEIVGRADFKNSETEITAQTSTQIIPDIKQNFRVAALSRSDKWEIVSNIKMLPIKDHVIIVDANETQLPDIKKMKIFIIGDSTVHNTTTLNGIRIGMGWGDILGRYMQNSQNLFNLAQPGASSKSYKERSDLEYDGWFHNWHQTKEIINDTNITNGGYLFIQFGHNDEIPSSDIGTLPGIENSFYNELKEYVIYARDANLTPVLITPVERMEKYAGYETIQSHIKEVGDYAQTIRDLSQIENVLLLDLQHKSWSNFNNFRDSAALIKTFGYGDNTHFSPTGAKMIASWVKELICDSDNKILCTQFK